MLIIDSVTGPWFEIFWCQILFLLLYLFWKQNKAAHLSSCFIFSLHRTNSDTTALNYTMVTRAPDPQMQQHPQAHTHNETDSDPPPHLKINGVDSFDTHLSATPCSNQERKKKDGRQGEGGGEDEGGGHSSGHAALSNHHPNGWGNCGPPNTMPHNSNSKPPPTRSGHCAPQGYPEGGVGPPHDPREQQENVMLRRGFVPRTAPERVAQRKSSMAQLQQWVNQRRGMASQEDINR